MSNNRKMMIKVCNPQFLFSSKLFFVELDKENFWSPKEHLTFLKNVEQLLVSSDKVFHFMGTIIVLQKRGRMVRTEWYEQVQVIKGKNRILALFSLLFVINDELLRSENEDLVAEGKELLKFLFPSDLTSLLSLENDKGFEEPLLEVGDRTSSFVKKHKKDLIQLLLIIKRDLEFILYEVDDEEYAITISGAT